MLDKKCSAFGISDINIPRCLRRLICSCTVVAGLEYRMAKKYPIEAIAAPMGCHKFLRTVVKKQDSPWDADLTGSVASTVDAKVARFFTTVNILMKE